MEGHALVPKSAESSPKIRGVGYKKVYHKDSLWICFSQRLDLHVQMAYVANMN